MADDESTENRSGEKPSARKPHRFSRDGWKQVLGNVKTGLAKDHLSIVAAGVAFYAMLSMVPAIAATISIYGLVADPQDIQEHFAAMEGAMPEQANELLLQQMDRIAQEGGGAGWGALFGIALALWAASRAMKATMEALNIAYGREESRGFVRLSLVALGLTLAAVLLGIVAIGVIAVLPSLLGKLPLPGGARTAIGVAVWPLLLLIGIGGIALVYRYGPSCRQPRWKWLTWGSSAAAILWLIVSALFSFYVGNFGNYNEMYGSLGAIVILMLWFWVSAFAVLFGAELDAAMEEQTKKDGLA